MDQFQMKCMIEENAEEIRRLHARIHETFKDRDKSPEKRHEWQCAGAEFHSRYNQLAFPGGYAGACERILAGEPNTIEAALCFIECRPYFFRSGYMYQKILRKLKHAPLTGSHSERLAAIVAAYAEWRKAKT